MPPRKIQTAAALFWMIGAVTVLCSSAAMADSTIVVNPDNMGSWSFYTTDNTGVIPSAGNGTGQMVVGPATPPAGMGSAHFVLPSGSGDQSVQLRSTGFAGIALSDITSLSYSTYATSIGGDQLPFFNISVSTMGNGVYDDRLWFEPVYSGAGAGNGNLNPQQGIQLNQWQTWNAFTGMWYTDSGTPNANAFAMDPNGPGDHAITWSEFLMAYPNATIANPSAGLGGIRFASGFSSDTDSYNTNVDAFTIGINGVNTTYDFEAVPESSTWVAAALAAGMLAVQLRRARIFSKAQRAGHRASRS